MYAYDILAKIPISLRCVAHSTFCNLEMFFASLLKTT